MKFVILVLLNFVLIGCLGTSSGETLLGEDKDNNGVRDDVDRNIEKNFKGKNNQNAVKKLAKYKIESLILRNSKDKLEKNSDNITRAFECYRNLNPKKKKSIYGFTANWLRNPQYKGKSPSICKS
jgi:hypothetical protein